MTCIYMNVPYRVIVLYFSAQWTQMEPHHGKVKERDRINKGNLKEKGHQVEFIDCSDLQDGERNGFMYV